MIRDITYHAFWLIMLSFSLLSAHIGILLWIWVSLLSPTDVLYNMLGVIAPFNKIVAALVILMVCVEKRKKDFYIDPLIILVAMYAIVVTWSYLLELVPLDPADLQFDKFWKELVLFVLITGIMYSRHRIHQAVTVVSIALGFVMAKEGVIYLATAGGHKIEGLSTAGDNNGLACIILMVLPLLLWVARYTATRLIRLGMYGTASLGAVTIVATQSRGGFVGLVVLCIMMLQGSKHKFRAILLITVAGAALYATMSGEYLDRIDTISTADQDSSFMTRVTAWKINLLIALDHPFFGGGPYASLAPSTWHQYASQATEFLFPSPVADRTLVAHSIYFQVLGDTGFFGLALFLAILGVAVISTHRTRRLARGHAELAWAADLARATQTSLVVYCVAGAALSLVYFEMLYILLAIVSRTYRTTSRLVERQAVPSRVGHFKAASRQIGGPQAGSYRAPERSGDQRLDVF